eukprot:2306814-Pleurochrysis_carterae.AAC.1
MLRRAIDMQSAVQQVKASPLLWRQEHCQRVWEARRWPARDFVERRGYSIGQVGVDEMGYVRMLLEDNTITVTRDDYI